MTNKNKYKRICYAFTQSEEERVCELSKIPSSRRSVSEEIVASDRVRAEGLLDIMLQNAHKSPVYCSRLF